MLARVYSCPFKHWLESRCVLSALPPRANVHKRLQHAASLATHRHGAYAHTYIYQGRQPWLYTSPLSTIYTRELEGLAAAESSLLSQFAKSPLPPGIFFAKNLFSYRICTYTRGGAR